MSIEISKLETAKSKKKNYNNNTKYKITKNNKRGITILDI